MKLVTNVVTCFGQQDSIKALLDGYGHYIDFNGNYHFGLNLEHFFPVPGIVKNRSVRDTMSWIILNWGTAGNTFYGSILRQSHNMVEIQFMSHETPPGVALDKIASSLDLHIELWADMGKEIIESCFPIEQQYASMASS